MIEHVFPARALMTALVLLMLVIAGLVIIAFAVRAKRDYRSTRPWSFALLAVAVSGVLVLLTGCATPIQPVKFQTVPVLITRPCYAGVTPPAEAVEIGPESCPGKYAECVRDRKADILELQREAKQYRQLFKECSK